MSHYRSQTREVINRNTVVSLALEQGFNAFLPVYDGGVDFILYHEGNGTLRKVQLKSRWTIHRKYLGRDIWIAFPIDADWYLMPHDDMVARAGRGVLESVSWVKESSYSRPELSEAARAQCAAFRFAPIADVAAKAADEGSDA